MFMFQVKASLKERLTAFHAVFTSVEGGEGFGAPDNHQECYIGSPWTTSLSRMPLLSLTGCCWQGLYTNSSKWRPFKEVFAFHLYHTYMHTLAMDVQFVLTICVWRHVCLLFYVSISALHCTTLYTLCNCPAL